MYIIVCGSTFIPNKILITVYFFLLRLCYPANPLQTTNGSTAGNQ